MSVIRLPSASALRTSLFEKVQLGALKAVTDLDIAGAHPADAFLDLPSETDFPDYYTAIPEPVSINLIIDRVKNHKYRTLQAFKDDFELMILNCEHYNKKSAGIVKDAGVLKETFERVLEGLMKENGLELGEAIESKSKSKTELNLLREIVDKLIAHKSKDGRSTSEVFMDLPSREEYPDYYTTITNPISLNLILSNVDANKYATPADLQTDLDIMFENAKKYNQEGSAVYADAEELQRAARKLIKPPTIIVATAAAPPTPPVVIPEIPTDPGVEVSSFTREGTEYRIGDYVYTTPTAASGLASVAQIHAITLHDNGEHTFHGLWFWYPEQTVHRANQKFYENEVVKSQRTEVYHEAELRGKCMVLYFKEYPKYKSLDFDGKDVYICEFRYHEAGKNLHRIKDWPGTFPRGIKSIEELGYKFEELNPPLKVERTVVIHHADGGGGAGAAAGDEEGGSGDDEEMEVVEPAPRPRKKERKPTVRQQSPIAPGISPVFGTPFPMAPTPVPPPKQQRAAPAPPPPPAFRMTSGKPAIGTVPWIPTPSVPSAIKVSVGKSDRVNPEVASKFATTIDGKLLWFQQPPIDVVQPPKPMHSLKYLEWKLAQGRREVEVEPPRKRARVEGAEAGAELLESVTQGLAGDWQKAARELRDRIYPREQSMEVS